MPDNDVCGKLLPRRARRRSANSGPNSGISPGSRPRHHCNASFAPLGSFDGRKAALFDKGMNIRSSRFLSLLPGNILALLPLLSPRQRWGLLGVLVLQTLSIQVEVTV